MPARDEAREDRNGRGSRNSPPRGPRPPRAESAGVGTDLRASSCVPIGGSCSTTPIPSSGQRSATGRTSPHPHVQPRIRKSRPAPRRADAAGAHTGEHVPPRRGPARGPLATCHLAGHSPGPGRLARACRLQRPHHKAGVLPLVPESTTSPDSWASPRRLGPAPGALVLTGASDRNGGHAPAIGSPLLSRGSR